MPAYKTGKTTLWTFSGSLTWKAEIDKFGYPGVEPLEFYRKVAEGSVGIAAGWGYINEVATITIEAVHIFRYPSPPRPQEGDAGRLLTCRLFNVSQQASKWETYPVGQPYFHSGWVDWSVSIPVEEWVNIEETSLSDVNLWKKSKLTFYWKPIIGEEANLTATLYHDNNGKEGEVTLSYTIQSGDSVQIHTSVRCYSFTQFQDELGVTGSIQQTHSITDSPLPLTNPNYDVTYQRTGWSERLRAYSTTQELTLQKTSSSLMNVSSNATVTRYAVLKYRIAGKISALGAPYTDTCQVGIRAKKNTDVVVNVDNNGNFLYDGQQDRYYLTWSANNTYIDGDKYSAIYGWLLNPSNIPEHGNAAVLQFRTWRWDALRIELNRSNLIAQTNSLSGIATWSAQYATVSVDNGRIRVDTAATGVPTVTVQFSGVRYLRTYRWWKLNVEASVPESNITLVVGSKQWQTKAGTTPSTWWIDTVMPNNASVAYDAKITDYDETESALWGVHKHSSLQFVLDNNKTYWLSDFEQYIRNIVQYPRLTFCDSYGFWVNNRRRFVHSDVEGRQGLELTDLIIGTGEVKISGLASAINSQTNNYATYPGWSATALDPPSGDIYTYFLNQNIWCKYLGGAGLVYNGTQWVQYIDVLFGPNSPLTIPAQYLANEIVLSYGSNLFFQDDTPGETKLALGGVLRSASFGVVYTTNKQPAEGETVFLRQESPLRQASSAVSVQHGAYNQKQAPMAIGDRTATTIFYETSVTRTHYSRMLMRAVLLGTVPQLFAYFAREAPNTEHVVELFIEAKDATQRECRFRFGGFGEPVGKEDELVGNITLTSPGEKAVGLAVVTPNLMYLWTMDTSPNPQNPLRVYLLQAEGYRGNFSVTATLIGNSTSIVGSFPIAHRHAEVLSTAVPGLFPNPAEWTLGITRNSFLLRTYIAPDTVPNFSVNHLVRQIYNPFCGLVMSTDTTNSKVALWRISSVGDSSNYVRVIHLATIPFAGTLEYAAGAIMHGKLYLFVRRVSGGSAVSELYTFRVYATPPIGEVDLNSPTVNVISTGDLYDCVFREDCMLLYNADVDGKSEVIILSEGGTPHPI